MTKFKSYKELELTAGGGTHSLDLSKGYEVYYVYTSGSVTLTSSWTITDDTSVIGPKKGMEIFIRYRADVDLNGNSITIFGYSLDSELTSMNFDITLYYDGSNWVVQTEPDFEESGFIKSRHILDDGIKKEDVDFADVLGNGLHENNSKAEVQPDTNTGTSITVGSDGTSLDGDENSPTDNKIYSKVSGSKGWNFLDKPISRYDSGWKLFPDSVNGNTGNGLPRYSNFTGPAFRIIGRTVFLTGRLLIPLDDGNGSLVTDSDNTTSTQTTTVHTSSTDFSISNSNGVGITISTPRLLDDSELDPERLVFYQNPLIGLRRIQAKGNTKILTMTAPAVSLQVETDSSVQISSVSNFEIPPAAVGDANTHLKSILLRNIATVANADDFYLDYTNFRSSHDGTSFQDQPEKGNEQYNITIDTTDTNDWGGFIFSLEGITWQIDSATDLETIRSKFSNYTDA